MKKLYSLLLFILPFVASNAQQIAPVIKPGTTIDILLNDQGQEVPIRITVKHLGDTLNFSWQENYANATSAKGKKISPKEKKGAADISKYFIQPHQEGIPAVRLQNDETLITLSKAAYQNLIEKKKVTYKGRQYLIIPDKSEFKVQHTSLNATYLQTDNYRDNMWVLNDADFPLILEIKTNPLLGNVPMNVLITHPERVRQTVLNYTVTDIK